MNTLEKSLFMERHVRLHGGLSKNQILILFVTLFILFGCEVCFLWKLFQTDFQHADKTTLLLFVYIFGIAFVAIDPLYTYQKETLRNRREMLASAERIFNEVSNES